MSKTELNVDVNNQWIITLAMPKEAADRLLKSWQEKDPVLMKALEEFHVVNIVPRMTPEVYKELTGEDW